MYREPWVDEILCGRSVVQVALDVHMTTTGAMERDIESQKADLRALKNVLSTWRESANSVCKTFDDSVFQLISVALTQGQLALEDY